MVPVLIACVAVCAAVAAFAVYKLTAKQPTAQPSSAPRTAAAAAVPDKVWPVPKPEQFAIDVKILEKKCFGSAGCIVKFKIQPSYSGPELEVGSVWDVTYEIKGGEDVQINTFELEGTSEGYAARFQSEESIDTRRSSDKLTAVATFVSER